MKLYKSTAVSLMMGLGICLGSSATMTGPVSVEPTTPENALKVFTTEHQKFYQDMEKGLSYVSSHGLADGLVLAPSPHRSQDRWIYISETGVRELAKSAGKAVVPLSSEEASLVITTQNGQVYYPFFVVLRLLRGAA